MSHYSAYVIINTDEEMNTFIDLFKFGSADINQYNQIGLHFNAYKTIDSNNSKIIGLKSRYGNNG